LLEVAGRAAPKRRSRQWGVTFDRPAGDRAVRSVADLFGRHGWVRVVFDAERGPRAYKDTVGRLGRAGLHVTGELLDSSELRQVPLAEFKKRVATYVDALPSVDAWEVGNEVNLRGLGPDVAEKVAFATDYVRRHTSARTLLTLGWQLGEDAPRYSTFGWLDRHPELVEEVDDVGLSLYPDQNPLGSSLERVMRTLHARLPGKRIMISELGYATPDGEPLWSWANRRAVARFYQSAIMAYPFSGGGAYWWYFLEEAPRGSPLWRTLRGVYSG
jgi:hypothetical protein